MTDKKLNLITFAFGFALIASQYSIGALMLADTTEEKYITTLLMVGTFIL